MRPGVEYTAIMGDLTFLIITYLVKTYNYCDPAIAVHSNDGGRRVCVCYWLYTLRAPAVVYGECLLVIYLVCKH